MAVKPAKQAKLSAAAGNKPRVGEKKLVKQAKAQVKVDKRKHKKQQLQRKGKAKELTRGEDGAGRLGKKRPAVEAHGTESEVDKSAKRLRKDLKHKRQAKDKPHALKVQEAVALWEKIRAGKTSSEEKSKLIDSVLGSFKGSLAMVALSAKASRVIQACLKHGNEQQRGIILSELEACLVDLCKDKYAHFLAIRMFDNASKAEKSRLIKALQGHMAVLIRHPAAASVVDAFYSTANATQRAKMLAEIWGPQFRLFPNAEGPSYQHIANAMKDATKPLSVLQHTFQCLQPVIDKSLVDCALVHHALCEYLPYTGGQTQGEMLESLAGDPWLHLLHTRNGAAAASFLFTAASAKVRKKIVKACKSHVLDMAKEESGHMACLCMLAHLDDTTLARKGLLSELRSEFGSLAVDKYGSRVILHLLAPQNPKYFNRFALDVVRGSAGFQGLQPGDSSASDVDDRKEEGDAQESKQQRQKAKLLSSVKLEPKAARSSSKKDPSIRSKELLGDGIGEGIVDAVLAEGTMRSLMTCAHGSEVVVEAATSSLLSEVCPNAVAKLHDGLARDIAMQSRQLSRNPSTLIASEAEEKSTEQAKRECLSGEDATIWISDFFASRAVCRLIKSPQPETSGGKHAAAVLWENSFADNLAAFAKPHTVKLIAAFGRCADEGTRRKAEKAVKKLIASGCPALSEADIQFLEKSFEGKS